MATENLIDEQEEREQEQQEHSGGGRFNRLLGVTFVGAAMLGGVVLALGVRSSGTSQDAAVQRGVEDPDAVTRDRGEIDDLAAHGVEPHPAPSFIPPPAVITGIQRPIEPTAPEPPNRYAQWAADKLMKALESPQMVPAFHGGQTLEIASSKGQPDSTFNSVNSNTTGPSEQTTTVHPPASAYMVMAGSVIPAVLVSGINSDLPGPIIAQVSENVLDSATGQYLLIPKAVG
jgi:type IV secretory pathway VirB10-like protein